MSTIRMLIIVLACITDAVADELTLEQRAMDAFTNHSYFEATNMYARLLYANPDNLHYKIQLAKSYQKTQKYDKSNEMALSVLDGIAQHHMALSIVATNYLMKRDYETARHYHNLWVAANPDDPYAYLGLSSVLNLLGDESAADEAFDRYEQLIAAAQ